MRVNLRLHSKRDADLIRHLSRLRDGALSDEIRRLIRAGLSGGGTMAPPTPFPSRQPAATDSPKPPLLQGIAEDLSDIERAIADAAWD